MLKRILIAFENLGESESLIRYSQIFQEKFDVEVVGIYIKDIRKNYIGSLRIQVKGKEVPKFKDKETFPVETVFLKNARNEGFVFFVF